MRILALNWRCLRHPQAGGSEINLFEQARRWVRDGHEVTVFTSDPGRAAAPVRDEVEDGVAVIRRGGQFGVYLWAALFLLTHGSRFDAVLDVANGIPFFAPIFTRRPTSLLVHHVHGKQWYTEFPKPLAWVGSLLEQRMVPLLYRGNPVIAVSPTTREALEGIGVDGASIRVIYNGVESPEPAGEARTCKEDGMETLTGSARIAYVGRLKRYKRVEKLVDAVARLRPEFANVHLDIAGDGDARPAIESRVRELGLEQNVTVHGLVDKQTKAAILRCASVFAMPSMHEGWGLSVIEANAYGLPAVAYDVPGLRVAVRDGETGLLAQDDDGFVAALGRLLREKETRRRYSESAQQWSFKFDWDACAQQTLEVLQSCSVPEGAGSARRSNSRSAA